jgi:hypothetical protein
MRLLLVLLLALAASVARAQAPDFTSLVRDAGPAVVALTGGQSLVLPDLPLAEEDVEADEEEADPELLRDFLRASMARRSTCARWGLASSSTPRATS